LATISIVSPAGPSGDSLVANALLRPKVVQNANAIVMSDDVGDPESACWLWRPPRYRSEAVISIDKELGRESAQKFVGPALS
jgi:hypothetical protein